MIKRLVSIIIFSITAALNAAQTDISVIGMVDFHCDTITTAMESGAYLFENELHIDFKRLKEYGAPVQVFSIWCAEKYLKDAFSYTDLAIDFFLSQIEASSESVSLALTYNDIIKNAREGKISAILAIEGGEALEGSMDNLLHFYNRGVRIITLTWNNENELAYGVGTGSDKGLKPFGIECVKKMNELGIIIDVSHLNEAGFWDVDNISEKPYMASHSNAYSITPNKRNLKDGQIKAIAEKGGIIGLNLYPYFLNNTKNAGLDDILAHINHISELGAIKNIGLGCDYDGIGITPAGFSDVSKLNTLADALDDDISADVMYKNFIDFAARVWKCDIRDIRR